MSTALTYGYYKPDTGENGTIFCPLLSDNWERIADHSHDGADSVKLVSSAISTSSSSAPAGSWAVDGARYKQSVALPTGYKYDTSTLVVMDSTTGERFYTTIEKVDADNFYIYTNDNSLTFLILVS